MTQNQLTMFAQIEAYARDHDIAIDWYSRIGRGKRGAVLRYADGYTKYLSVADVVEFCNCNMQTANNFMKNLTEFYRSYE